VEDATPVYMFTAAQSIEMERTDDLCEKEALSCPVDVDAGVQRSHDGRWVAVAWSKGSSACWRRHPLPAFTPEASSHLTSSSFEIANRLSLHFAPLSDKWHHARHERCDGQLAISMLHRKDMESVC